MTENTITIELSEPVQAHGEMIKSLTFKSPNGKALVEAGFPYKIEQNKRNREAISEVFDLPNCRMLLSLMAEVPPSTIDQLNFGDFNDALGVIPRFLAQSIHAKSLNATSSSADGPAT